MKYETFKEILNSHVNKIHYDIDDEDRDVNTYKLIIDEPVCVGGVTGGSCWEDSNPHAYSTDKRADKKIIKTFILEHFPNITLNQYEAIDKLIFPNSYTQREYYGNENNYKYYTISRDALLRKLLELDMLDEN